MKAPGAVLWVLITALCLFAAQWAWTNHQSGRIDGKVDEVNAKILQVDAFSVQGCIKANKRVIALRHDVLVTKKALLTVASTRFQAALAAESPKMAKINRNLAKSYQKLADDLVIPEGPRICRS